MELEIDAAVQAKLLSKLGPDKRVLLSYNDGVGPYSHHGLIALQVDFQIVIIAADMPMTDYEASLTMNLGTWYVKGYSTSLLDERMRLTLNTTYGTIQLSGNEMIDDNVEIVDASHNV